MGYPWQLRVLLSKPQCSVCGRSIIQSMRFSCGALQCTYGACCMQKRLIILCASCWRTRGFQRNGYSFLCALSWPEHGFNLDSHRLKQNGEVTKLYAPQSCSVTFSELEALQGTAVAGEELVVRTLGYWPFFHLGSYAQETGLGSVKRWIIAVFKKEGSRTGQLGV